MEGPILQRSAALILKFLRGELTGEEQQELDNWLAGSEEHRRFFRQFQDEQLVEQRLTRMSSYNKKQGLAAVWEKVMQTQKAENEDEVLLTQPADAAVAKRRSIVLLRLGYAAAIALLLGAGGLLYFILRTPEKTVIQPTAQDILPATNKATLTLADGTVILLDSNVNSMIRPGIRQQGGQLHYERITTASLNTLTTPRNGFFSVQLPDGTIAWLNAESSIKYPTVFKGNERLVEVTGETYFDVAPHASMPFVVHANGMNIKVLGTQFNINTYKDEPAPTATLVQGRISVNGTMLQPGQQAALANEQITITDRIDISQITAWKNGLFSFHKTALTVVMKQLARWYDVDIVYEGTIPKRYFGGEIERSLRLSDVLELLRETGVNFRIEGRKVIVKP